MDFVLKSLLFFLFSVMVVACLPPPRYSSTPQIQFKDLKFIDTKDPSVSDSLVLFITFQDGEGDLGLANQDIGITTVDNQTLFFNNRFYFTADKHPIIYYQEGFVLTYADKRQRPELNLPDYIKPYSCTNWEIKKTNDRQDTIYFELNENHYNIFVDFYVKQNDGSFRLFSWRKKYCSTFNGRFPVLSKRPNEERPLQGTLQYSMLSSGFKLQFGTKTLKLKITIQDRLQHRSNIIETPEFQFL